MIMVSRCVSANDGDKLFVVWVCFIRSPRPKNFRGFVFLTQQQEKVKELIGKRVEWIAFLNRFIEGEDFDFDFY